MKVHLVEDDTAIREILEDVLTSEGYECVASVDGSQAKLNFSIHSHFALMVSDFRMPNCGGVELLHWCRENGYKLPVVFITANLRLSDEEKLALQDPLSTLIFKPIGLDEFLVEIHRACNLASKRL